MSELSDKDKDRIRLISQNSSKLLTEVQRLHRDVMILKGRIEPFDGEDISKFPKPKTQKATWKLRDALDIINECRQIIYGIERDVQNCLARIKVIEDDVVSREEMKPWLGQNRRDPNQP